MPENKARLGERILNTLRYWLRDHDEFFVRDPQRPLPACRIRPLQDADFEACEEIYRLNEAAHFPPDFFGEFQDFFRGRKAYVLVAEVEGAIRGFGGISIHPHHAIQAAGLSFGMVHPDFRKQGFGTALLLARLASLPTPRKVWIVMMSSAGGSATFYARFGFSYARDYIDPGSSLEFSQFYVKLRSGDRIECRHILEKASIVLESDSSHIPDFTPEAIAEPG